jgi:hypothetical protein
MVLRYFGKHAELGDVVRQVGVYPNVTQRWIDELAKDNGLIFKYYRTGSAWYQFPRIDGSMDISYIKVHIDHGIPVMAGQRYSLSNPSGHVRVVTGYNDQMQVLYINDPANAYVGQMSYDEFQELWKFSGSAINEAYVLYPSKAWQSTTYTTQLTTQVQSSQFTTSQTTTSIIETTRVLSTETSIIHTGEPLSTEVGPPTVPVELLAVGGIISILLAVAVVFMMRRKK